LGSSHARRGFYQALKESLSEAVWFTAQIRQLSPAERYCLRQEQAPPLWEAMKKHAEELQPRLSPKSILGKAVNYFLNEYDALRA
jgi:hypothetical protein